MPSNLPEWNYRQMHDMLAERKFTCVQIADAASVMSKRLDEFAKLCVSMAQLRRQRILEETAVLNTAYAKRTVRPPT